ncbi:MAG: zf-HC2 domain-containing protein [Armatimonadetes bacterium]|nr:zf-HC2 domain-containing protein [Armatimonadota bacterium]
MLTCEKCERIIARYVVGALPPWSRVAVTRHLDACPPCQRIVESHYRVTLLMERIPGEDPPTGLWNRISNEIAQEPPGHDRVPSTPRDWRPSLLVAAAGLTVGVFLGQAFNTLPEYTGASTVATMADTSPQIATFVRQHSRMAADDPFADRVSLAAYQTAAFREAEQVEGETVTIP